MKNSIKLSFLALLLIPIITCMGIYNYALQFEQLYIELPINDSLETAKTTQNIQTLRGLALTSLEGYDDVRRNEVDLSFLLLQYLLATAFLNAILLYSIYTYYRDLVSNKSVKQTG